MKSKRSRTLLGGVSATAMTLALGTSIAFAGSTGVTYRDDGAVGFNFITASATGNQYIDGINANQNLVSSSITANVVGVPVLGGTASSSSATIESNALKAASTGNSVTSTADLEALDTGGIGIANAAVNSHAAAAVTSAIQDSDIRLTASTLDSGSDSLSNSDNSVAASTTLNANQIASNGAIPNAYSSSTGGVSALTFDPSVNGNLVTSNASIAATNAQLNSLGVAGRSSASVTDNSVATTVTPDSAGQVLSSSIDTDGNSISADYAGNASVSQIAVAAETDADSGVNPTFNGSIALSNVQANLQSDFDADPDAVKASNVGSRITADVGLMTPGSDSASLRGSLSVSDNSISSSAVGNKAGTDTAYGNDVIVMPGIGYAGNASGAQSNGTSFDGLSSSGLVSAGLSVLSSQSNVATAHTSETSDAFISSNVQDLQNGSVDTSSNTISSSAAGNDASSRIITQNQDDIETPSFAGTAALANAQVNSLSSVSASIDDANVFSVIGNETVTGGTSAFTDATVKVEDNTSLASAKGNGTQNLVQIGANTVDLGSGPAAVSGGDHTNGNVFAGAGASLTNLQANHASDVTAANNQTIIGVTAADVSGDLSNDTVAVKGNRIGSDAIGNDGSNKLALEGTSVTGSGGLSSVQVTGIESDVSATTSTAGVSALTGPLASSTVSVDDNTIAADAVANRVNNAFSASAESLQIATSAVLPGVIVDLDGAAPDGALFDSENPGVDASLAMLNSQSLASDVTSMSMNSGFNNQTVSLTDSHISTSGNTLHGEGIGNQATNAMTVGGGTASVPELAQDIAAAAAVANIQSRLDGSDVVTTVGGTGTEFGASVLGDDSSDSTVKVNGNTTEAYARGSTATNSLDVTATTLALGSPDAMTGLTVGPDGEIASDLAFSLVNAQSGGTGLVSATQGQIQALASIADDVNGSSVELAGNTFVAGAFDNAAKNGLTIDAGNINASGGVSNFQSSSAQMSATSGNPGVAAVPGGTYNVNASSTNPTTGFPDVGSGPSSDGSGGWLYNGTLYSTEDMSAVAGWTEVVGHPGVYMTTVTDYVISNETYLALANPTGGSFNFAGTTPGTAGIAATPSVIAQVGDDIINSSVSVTDNVSQATAISNSATNTLAVAGGVVDGGAGIAAPGASIDLVDGNFIAASDFAVSNVQLEDGASVIADANGTYAVEADDVIGGSTISVTGNQQQATAEGNKATNGLSLDATNLEGSASPTASLLSAQLTGDEDPTSMAATSWMDVHAPAASTASNIALSDNRNVALSVANDADNGHVNSDGTISGGLAVTGTNIDGSSTGDAFAMTAYPFDGLSTVADYMANNAQANTRDGIATVTTTVQNQDSVAASTAGLQNGTADLSGNVSIAEARGNKETTAVQVVADANLDATSALLNTQVSDADLTASADGSVNFGLTSNYFGTFTGTVNNSSLTLGGNQVVARAVSNDASNASLVSGTNIDAVDANAASASFGSNAFATSADHVVNSGQASSGLATAVATGSVNADIVASDLTQGTSVSASTVSLDGNITAAEARGNNASNQLVLDAASNLGATGAVLNAQTRSIDGGVSATATGNVGLTALAALDTGRAAFQSSLGVTDNVTQAIASANSATNALTASAGAGYSDALAGTGNGYSTETTGMVDAAYAVLNGQSNDASVTATASAEYTVGMVGGVTGSALNASGNQVLASAVGNTASNSLVLSALAGDNPSAGISSTQVNTGPITAMVSGTTVSLTGGTLGEGIVGSSLGIRSNTISAGATGNSVVNSIKAR